MSRSWWPTLRLLGGAAILAVLVWRLGTGPFLDGVDRIDTGSLAAATLLTALTTVCCAWRWSLVARGLGVRVPLRAAVPAYYRSQFLNTTLPGGVLGDVHRAVRHGRDVGDLGRSLRAVGWERSAGQVVQVALALIVLLLLPSPVRGAMPAVAAAAAWSRWPPSSRCAPCLVAGRPWWRAGCVRRPLTSATGCFRGRRGPASCSPPRWPWPVTSVTFLVAARTAGSTASPISLLPLALLVLLAMGVPTNIAGWGPREGVAAWAFGVAGLGAAQGVATAVVYGVMVLVASLPGAAVLVVDWLRQESRRPVGAGRPLLRSPVTASPEGAGHG